MYLVRDAGTVLLDTSVFYRFCDGHQLRVLKVYLASRARISREVARELFVAPRDGVYRDLATIREPPWPKRTGQVPSPLRLDADRLIQEARLQDARDNGTDIADVPLHKHAGEVTTVIMAQHLRADLVVVDDRFGKDLARARKIPRISTAQLCLQMVVEGQLSEGEGFSVFDLATPPAADHDRYLEALRNARRDMV